MQINLVWDATAQGTDAASFAFRQGVQEAAYIFDTLFKDDITVNLDIGYGVNPESGTLETAGGASAEPAHYLGSLPSDYYGYQEVRTWLSQHASADVQSGIGPILPTSATVPVNGGNASDVYVYRAQQKLMGKISATDTDIDGYAGFAKDIPFDQLVGVAVHELSHAMGRVTDAPVPNIMELFRFSSKGKLLVSNAKNVASYFSLDGGTTDLADYGQTSDTSDFLNPYDPANPRVAVSNRTPNDPFNEFYDASTAQVPSVIDLLQMEALGFHTTVESLHANDLAYATSASGSNHFVDILNFEASFPDLVKAFGTDQTAARNWYNNFEPREGRVETFDGLDYIASNGDLITAFRNLGTRQQIEDAGATHYINYGLDEGRGQGTFNGLDYIASYSDLIHAFGADSDAGAYHYIAFGNSEARRTTFDGLDYIASYGDLINAFGTNEQAGASHYINYGLNEGRSTTFDGLSYIANYTDLMQAFGANNDAGATHFIDYGLSEGRSTSFDYNVYMAAHPDLTAKFGSNQDLFYNAYINNYQLTGTMLT